ncbi:MAG: hypothetical protein ABIH26_00570 [Candidatus Eisenbacteria bacterium]
MNNAIRPDGQFGTDYWDAARLGIAIEHHALHPYFPSYPSLAAYLRGGCGPDLLDAGTASWRGPGFHAIAAEYLLAIGEKKRAEEILDRLVERQEPNGDWVGEPAISPVWHGAQCVLAMVHANPERYRDGITRGCERIASTQLPAGNWQAIQQYVIYFTSYAILALVCDRARYGKAVDSALTYLKSRMSPDGKCSDLGGTLMCALALESATRAERPGDPPLVDIIMAEKALDRVEAVSAENDRLRAEYVRIGKRLTWYEQKYRDADVVLTKKEAFLVTVAALVVTVLGAVVPPLILDSLHKQDAVRAPTAGEATLRSLSTDTGYVSVPRDTVPGQSSAAQGTDRARR